MTNSAIMPKSQTVKTVEHLFDDYDDALLFALQCPNNCLGPYRQRNGVEINYLIKEEMLEN